MNIVGCRQPMMIGIMTINLEMMIQPVSNALNRTLGHEPQSRWSFEPRETAPLVKVFFRNCITLILLTLERLFVVTMRVNKIVHQFYCIFPHRGAVWPCQRFLLSLFRTSSRGISRMWYRRKWYRGGNIHETSC